MFKHCPGTRSLVSPKIIVRSCPFCGEEIEFFEYETQQECYNCGKIVYREPSEICIIWCDYAEKCVSELESKSLISKDRAAELRKLMTNSKQKT